MDACGCAALDVFDRASAEHDLARYRRRGPDASTRMLLDMLRSVGVRGATVLDVGAGIGVIDHELLREGVSRAVLVDGSSASLAVARDLGRERSTLDRLEFHDGDFVAMAPRMDAADIVTLDRVVCCYPDVEALVGASAARARRWYGLVLPRDRWFIRVGLRLFNAWYRLRGRAYRAYAHRNDTVDAILAEAGLHPTADAATAMWRVVLYGRAD